MFLRRWFARSRPTLNKRIRAFVLVDDVFSLMEKQGVHLADQRAMHDILRDFLCAPESDVILNQQENYLYFKLEGFGGYLKTRKDIMTKICRPIWSNLKDNLETQTERFLYFKGSIKLSKTEGIALSIGGVSINVDIYNAFSKQTKKLGSHINL